MIRVNLIKEEVKAFLREKARIKQRKRRAKNPEKLNKIARDSYHRHIEKNRAKNKAWYYSEAGLAYHLKSRYNITLEKYKELFEKQNGVCPGCKNPPKAFGPIKRDLFVVDHDHATGLVRDLLCWNCNVALGHAKDSPEILRSLIVYLGK